MAIRQSWRTFYWPAAVAVLILPLAAMQITDEMNWGVEDFVAAAALLAGAGLLFEALCHTTTSRLVRVWAGLAITAALLLIWAELAVGLF